jgi:hypothetical protein
VEIGTEAMQFPEKEYMNGIFFAVYVHHLGNNSFYEMASYEISLLWFWQIEKPQVK